MVITVADGVGQELIAENMKEMGWDPSGNALLLVLVFGYLGR
jgi:hypothetical protein